MEHIDELVEMWVELARDQQRYGSLLKAERNREHIRDTLGRSIISDEVLVAEVDELLVGFVNFSTEYRLYEVTATRGIIHNLFVRRTFRNDGIGSKLLEAAEHCLADQGVETVALEVMAANTAAQRFYENSGYDLHRLEFTKRTDSAETVGVETDNNSE